jgi:protocatechuate 3,4-dioxygenase beta subunit
LTLLVRGAGAAGPAKAAGATSESQKLQVHLAATPQVTEGPFFVDENLNRSDLVAGTDRPSVAKGLPLQLAFTVYDLETRAPAKGVHVDVWHADALGVYSDEAGGGPQSETTSGQKWLRGFQTTDENGVARFKTIYPGWYIGRTPHIHLKFRRYDAANKKTYEFTTQMFMDEKVNDAVLGKAPYNTRGARRIRNADDDIFSARQADGTAVGSHLILDLREAAEGGMAGAFSIALNRTGDQPGDGGPGRGGRRGGPGEGRRGGPRGGMFGPPPPRPPF